MASVALTPVTDPAHTSPCAMQDANVLNDTEPAPLQGTVSPPDPSQCVLADVTLSPEILTRVALQARLQAAISHRDLECERERAKALENLVHQLSTELISARQALARQAGDDRRL
jgi:hypothetical protein